MCSPAWTKAISAFRIISLTSLLAPFPFFLISETLSASVTYCLAIFSFFRALFNFHFISATFVLNLGTFSNRTAAVESDSFPVPAPEDSACWSSVRSERLLSRGSGLFSEEKKANQISWETSFLYILNTLFSSGAPFPSIKRTS